MNVMCLPCEHVPPLCAVFQLLVSRWYVARCGACYVAIVSESKLRVSAREVGGNRSRHFLFIVFFRLFPQYTLLSCASLIYSYLPPRPAFHDFKEALLRGVTDTEAGFLAVAQSRGIEDGTTALICCLADG